MAEVINKVFSNPVTEKDNLIKIVDIMKPEFLITIWKSSVWKNENSSKITSAMIRMVKNCSKKTLFISLNETTVLGKIILINQLEKE